MKKFNKNEIEDIVKNVEKSSQYDKCLSKPIRYFFSSGVLFVLLLAMNTLLKTTIGSLIISLSTFGIGSFLFFLEGIAVYKNPTSSFKRKYGKYFLEDETDFLFKNFEIPLCETVLGIKIQKFWEETSKTDFTHEMRQKAQYSRLKFYFERELPEEIRKYEESERKRKAAEYEEQRIRKEKRKKEKDRIEKQFEEYMEQYSTELETEKN